MKNSDFLSPPMLTFTVLFKNRCTFTEVIAKNGFRFWNTLVRVNILYGRTLSGDIITYLTVYVGNQKRGQGCR